MKLTIEATGKTDVGLVRANNEDNFGYDLRRGIFVVCDGMGGQAAGELASKIAVDTVLRHFQGDLHDSHTHIVASGFENVSPRANLLASALQLANQAIRQAAGLSPERAGMGSTIVAVSVAGNQFSVAHVGDSRAYLIRDGAIQQLTHDHSLVMEQVRRGVMTLEEAERSKLQNVIIRALGTDESVDPDLQDREFEPGDVLLLCSDGLSRYVEDGTLSRVVSQARNLNVACEELIQSAKDGKSDDNITCLVIRAQQRWWRWPFLVKLKAVATS